MLICTSSCLLLRSVKDTTTTQGTVVVENIAYPGGVIQVINKVSWT
jgi:hypothetical protein